MAATQTESEWLTLLRSKKRLEREKGLLQLKVIVEGGSLEEGERKRLETTICDRLSSLITPWEEKHGGILAAVLLVSSASNEFCRRIRGEIPLLLEDEESRVRLAAGTKQMVDSTLLFYIIIQ